METGCLVVGVLNVTPDSFSDGGRFGDVGEVVAAGVEMVAAGADWLDVGGESTRPGSVVVDAVEEMRRVLPVVRGLAQALGDRALISIDTYKAETARAAIEAGARVINDISGGKMDPAILAVAAETQATLVLGHLRGEPAKMMDNIAFSDVVAEVGTELLDELVAARAAGCEDVWVDPGIGFGKRGAHNLALLAELPALVQTVGVKVMVGVSRKAFIGQLTGKGTADRAFGTAAAVTAAVLGGARAVRVHDVAEMIDVVRVASAIVDAVRTGKTGSQVPVPTPGRI